MRHPLILSALFSFFILNAGAEPAADAAPTSAASTPAPAPAKPAPAAKESKWVFSLLPKSLQKNPRLEMTVITEMTDEGKKLPPVSAAQPAYYEMHTGGPKHLGDSYAGKFTLPESEMQPLLTRSLRANGYLPAERPAHPPSLMIIYTWGAHSMLREGDEENPVHSGNMVARNMLDRAALVGGDKFARELLRLFHEADAMEIAARAPVSPIGQPVFTPELMEFANPVSQFKRASPKNEFLIDQTAHDVFYAVATAYDYESMIANRRVLLWRTRMTVAAAGVSEAQSLPTLVLTAAPYFGKEMLETEVLSRRVLRDGTVEIGTPTVIEGDVPAPKSEAK